jgi:hypothetical protein
MVIMKWKRPRKRTTPLPVVRPAGTKLQLKFLKNTMSKEKALVYLGFITLPATEEPTMAESAPITTE